MGNRKSSIKQVLIDQCFAHDRLELDFELHNENNSGSKILIQMYQEIVKKLEGQIISNVKEYFDIGNTKRIKKIEKKDE